MDAKHHIHKNPKGRYVIIPVFTYGPGEAVRLPQVTQLVPEPASTPMKGRLLRTTLTASCLHRKWEVGTQVWPTRRPLPACC